MSALTSTLAALARALNTLQSPLALFARLYVSWVFLKSGWLKVRDWDQTVALFESEYHVPLLPYKAAAVAGTCGELFFPLLLVLGFAGRIGALGLFAVNLLAVIAYRHVLYQDGFEAAIGQHYLWGFMLLMLCVYGPGKWSLDGWLARRRAGWSAY